jgi:glutamate 5-kinase
MSSQKLKIVIKIGSRQLNTPKNQLDLKNLKALTSQIAKLQHQGHRIVLVSSGAILCGSEIFGGRHLVKTLPEKQAAASIGQVSLMEKYAQFFKKSKISIGQILLTSDEIKNGAKKKNALQTLHQLINLKVIPIINENDSVTTEEIQFGDNDILSAHVTELLGANLLIILSDVEGLYTANPKKDPNARVISLVTRVTSQIRKIATGETSSGGRGGFSSKIKAVEMLSKKKISVVVANGRRKNVLVDIVAGKNIGTRFLNK